MDLTLRRESIIPDNAEHWLRLRTQDITSTEVAALFGLSPYITQFELWHQKKNSQVVTLPPNERMTWGTRLQEAIARGIGEDNDWQVSAKPEYMRLPDYRIGSSFDYQFIPNAQPGDPFRLLEIKNVDALVYRDGWIETEYGMEAPAHIELQAQHQMLVAGARSTVIAGLVGGNRVILLPRDFDTKVGAGIMAACAEFWRSIDANEPPSPDFARDAEAIKNLYSYAEPDSVYDTPNLRVDELLREYYEATRLEGKAKLQKDTARAELLTIVGNAERVVSEGFKASCGMVGPAHIEAYERPAYRNFRVTPRKSA